MIMANHMVGYGLFTETTIPDQGLGKMYFEKLGRRVSRGKGRGGGDKALMFSETCNFLIVGVS